MNLSITPETGLIFVDAGMGSIELSMEDVTELVNTLHKTKLKPNTRQIKTNLESVYIEDLVQNNGVTMTYDDIFELGKFAKKNKNRIASRKDFNNN